MRLFTPIKIGTLELKNRLVMPALATGFASEDGRVTERMIRYYEERAKGGVGLIIVEFTAIERRGKSMLCQLMIDNDKLIPGLKNLTEAIKRYGARVAIQLQHGGEKATPKITQMQPVAPSVLASYHTEGRPAPRALTIREIDNLVLTFGQAARRAKEAGFDAIELHCTHSYLVDQFMSPLFNKRNDIYGGSIENRARFACNILECMKEKVGKGFPIICRITGDDYVVGGITLEDAKVNAGLLVKAGADAINLSIGLSNNMDFCPTMIFPRGCFVHLAQGIKEAVDVPVITVGRINDPIVAEQILQEGKADLIAMGRALVADPFLPQKAEKGQLDDIIPCIACNQGCMSRVGDGLGQMTCLVNPAVGKEIDFQIEPVSNPKKVLIVGAGPAGLKAAIVAKERGHNVILAEKEKRLGGQLNYACKPPHKEEVKRLINWFCKQVEKLQIETYPSKRVTKEFVNKIKPDVIVLCTGATPIFPDIPGIKGKKVFTSFEILEGKKPLGKRSIVIGGGQTGLETADFLAEAGHEVTVMEMLPKVGIDMPPRVKMFFLKELSKKKILIMTNCKTKEITEQGVSADHLGQQVELAADTVVLAAGTEPERGLLKDLEEASLCLEAVFVIGDCNKPRNALEAIYEGARIAMQI